MAVLGDWGLGASCASQFAFLPSSVWRWAHARFCYFVSCQHHVSYSGEFGSLVCFLFCLCVGSCVSVCDHVRVLLCACECESQRSTSGHSSGTVHRVLEIGSLTAPWDLLDRLGGQANKFLASRGLQTHATNTQTAMCAWDQTRVFTASILLTELFLQVLCLCVCFWFGFLVYP